MEAKAIASRIAHDPKFRPFLVVIGLMGLCSVLLARSVDVSLVDKAGVRMEMPATVGDWSGSQVWFCQKKGCPREQWSQDELGDKPYQCPTCDGEMSEASWVEWGVLPEDTGVLKFQYKNPDSKAKYYNAGIVLSGADRTSIHRPEQCMAGGGNEILREDIVMRVPRPGKKDLKVKVLEMRRPVKGPDGKDAMHHHFYAYWFVGDGRETHSHYARMIYMATDRVFFDLAHRWAYISVAGSMRGEGNQDYQEELKTFIAQLYGQLEISE